MIKKLTFLLILLSLFCVNAWTGTLKVEGTTNIQDTYVYSVYSDYNYGGMSTLRAELDNYVIHIRVENLSSLLPANSNITFSACSLKTSYLDPAGTVSAYRIFKPWVEGASTGSDPNFPLNCGGGCTWADWGSDLCEWGTGGCACAGDDGVDNSQDGTCDAAGRDRKSTAESSQNCTGYQWYGFEVSPTLAQGWYNQTINSEGIALIASGSADVYFHSTEGSDPPFWVFVYTTGEPEGRNSLLLKRQQKK